MALSHAQESKTLSQQLQGWLRRQSRRLPAPWHEATLVLLRLDLDPARPLLRSLDAPGPRGRPPADPVCMLRALLLMLLLHDKSLSPWAHDLRTPPRLAQMAGVAPFQTPAVGTFSTCIDRLEDGPSAPPWAHRVQPRRPRQGRHRRHLKQEQVQRHAAHASDPMQADTVTARLAQALLAAAAQPRAQELLPRLEDLRCTCGVLPSGQRGRLGDRQALVRCGDGATLPTGASPHSRPTCDGRAHGLLRCDHERCSTDATATWGSDASRAPFCFGHHAFQHGVVTSAHTVPVHSGIAPAHVTDCTMDPPRLDRCLTPCAAQALPVTGRAVVADRGLDAHGISQCVQAKTLAPLMALHPRRGGHPTPPGTATHVNDHGIPLCPAGLPMRRHSSGPGGRRIDDHGPVKRPTRRAGRLQGIASQEECPRHVLCHPHTPMGPVVDVRTTEDPRLYPPLPRDSAPCKTLLAQRTGCERSNALQKVASRLGARPCRSATPLLVRLYLVSLLEHACAWLAEDRTPRGEEPQGLTPRQGAAASSPPVHDGDR